MRYLLLILVVFISACAEDEYSKDVSIQAVETSLKRSELIEEALEEAGNFNLSDFCGELPYNDCVEVAHIEETLMAVTLHDVDTTSWDFETRQIPTVTGADLIYARDTEGHQAVLMTFRVIDTSVTKVLLTPSEFINGFRLDMWPATANSLSINTSQYSTGGAHLGGRITLSIETVSMEKIDLFLNNLPQEIVGEFMWRIRHGAIGITTRPDTLWSFDKISRF